MTKDEIMAMKPGRELDALVAEHVFGYKRVKTPKDYNGENGGTDVLVPPDLSEFYNYPPKGAISLWYFAKKWSTDISAAWEVVENLKHTFAIAVTSFKNGVLCKIQKSFNEDTIDVDVDSAPEAICKAALLVKMEAEE